jgi:Zn finger protein HypA/HybF involved in hydrogenase expression
MKEECEGCGKEATTTKHEIPVCYKCADLSDEIDQEVDLTFNPSED